jgi:hypothetical protein
MKLFVVQHGKSEFQHGYKFTSLIFIKVTERTGAHKRMNQSFFRFSKQLYTYIDAEWDGESFDANINSFETRFNDFLYRLLNYIFMQPIVLYFDNNLVKRFAHLVTNTLIWKSDAFCTNIHMGHLEIVDIKRISDKKTLLVQFL